MNKIISGGWLASSRTWIISGVGIISALAAYVVGDNDLFTMLGAIFTLGTVFIIRNKTKGSKNG